MEGGGVERGLQLTAQKAKTCNLVYRRGAGAMLTSSFKAHRTSGFRVQHNTSHCY